MLLIQILCEFQLNFEKQLQIIHNYMVKESIYSIEISQALSYIKTEKNTNLNQLKIDIYTRCFHDECPEVPHERESER